MTQGSQQPMAEQPAYQPSGYQQPVQQPIRQQPMGASGAMLREAGKYTRYMGGNGKYSGLIPTLILDQRNGKSVSFAKAAGGMDPTELLHLILPYLSR